MPSAPVAAAIAPPADIPAAPAAWRGRLRAVAMPLGFFLLLLGFWEAYVRITGIPAVILPGPLTIGRTLGEIYPILLQHAVPTTLEAAGGFLISCVVGVAIAVLLCYSKLWREAVYPNLVLIQVIPKIALAPLFVLWFGLGSESRLAFSVFISIFPVIISTYAGLTHVDPNLLRLCRTFRAREWQVFLSVRLPSALPFMFSGMKVAVTLAIIGVVIGEFITSQRGLGYLIVNTSARADTPVALAAVAMLCAAGLLLYGIVAFLQSLVNERYGREPIR